MKYKRVILILGTKFNKRDYIRFGVDIFRKYNLTVTIWNISSFIAKSEYDNYQPDDLLESWNPDSQNAVISAISKLNENDIALCIIGTSPSTQFIFDALNNFNIQYCLVSNASLPQIYTLQKRFNWKWIRSIFLSPIELLNRQIDKFKKYLSHSKIRPTFILVGAKDSRIKCEKSYPGGLVIQSHDFDYDRFLDNESTGAKDTFIQDDYAVFLDEALTCHPDYLYSGIDKDVDEDIYFHEINCFFNKFEQIFDIPVIIASHPRIDYKRLNNPFGRRRCIKNKTMELVKNSNIVLLHASRSINYAVLYQKPVIYLYSDHFSDSFNEKVFLRARTLKSQILNISDKSSEIGAWQGIDTLSYSLYKNQYIKSNNTQEISSWEIFCKHISVID